MKISPLSQNPLVDFDKQEIKTSLTARFESQVKKYPTNVAIKTVTQEITYDELNRRANRIARYICAKGTEEVEVVALLLEPGPEMIAAILAVLKTNKIWVSLDPSHPFDRVAYILKDSQATVILTSEQNMPLAAKLKDKQHALITLEEVDNSLNDDNLDIPVSPHAYAHLIYTSGSTGQPKGVLHNHQVILHNIHGHTNSFGIHPDDRIALFASLGFIAGISDLFRALLNGAALLPYSLKKNGFVDLPAWLNEEGITIYHSVPTVFRQLMNTLNGEEFPKMRIIHLGGEPVLKHDVELYKKHFPATCTLVVILGASEAPTFRHHFITKTTELKSDIVPVGYPVEDKEILLLDKRGETVGQGQVGEIAVRSLYLASEYWRKPELTQKVFLKDPDGSDKRIYRTGDLGRMLPDGTLIYLGRKDKMVKIGGQRVEIGEIETVLFELSSVKGCAVVAKENDFGDKYLTAYIVSRTTPAPTVTQLQDHLKQKLPVFMMPSKFVFLQELPLLPNGKVNRKVLQSYDDAARSNLGVEFVLPRDDIEHQLKIIWEEVLGVQPVGVKDNFFELGGTSLHAARLLTMIAQTFGKKLAPPTLFQLPTIEQLASVLRLQEWSASASSLITMRSSGSRPPFFCVPGNMSVPYIHLRYLADYLGPEQPFYGFQDGVQNPSRIEDLAATYLSEMVSVQSEGPYFLGGLCMGGLVAYEMAQQLLARGHKVALLAMMEPVPPRGLGVRSVVDIAALFLHRVMKRLTHHSQVAFQLSREEQKAYVRLKMKLNANSWALRRYSPRPYSGRIDLFLTPETLSSPNPSRLGWRDKAVNGIELHQIPGTNGTITGHNDTEIEEAHVRVLAQKLRECIDEACKEQVGLQHQIDGAGARMVQIQT